MNMNLYKTNGKSLSNFPGDISFLHILDPDDL